MADLLSAEKEEIKARQGGYFVGSRIISHYRRVKKHKDIIKIIVALLILTCLTC